MDITKKIEKAHSNGHLDKAATPSGKPEGNEINEPSQAYILMHAALFLATGICSTICNQMVFYHGASQPKSMLLSFPTYIGMILVVLLPLPKSAHKGVHSTSSQVDSADSACITGCIVPMRQLLLPDGLRRRLCRRVRQCGVHGRAAVRRERDLPGMLSSTSFSILLHPPATHDSLFRSVSDRCHRFCTPRWCASPRCSPRPSWSATPDPPPPPPRAPLTPVLCFFQGKTPSRIQWLGIFAIASGLCLTSHGSAPVRSPPSLS